MNTHTQNPSDTPSYGELIQKTLKLSNTPGFPEFNPAMLFLAVLLELKTLWHQLPPDSKTNLFNVAATLFNIVTTDPKGQEALERLISTLH